MLRQYIPGCRDTSEHDHSVEIKEDLEGLETIPEGVDDDSPRVEVHHSLNRGLPSMTYQSLDYDECPNRPYRALVTSWSSGLRTWNGFVSWILMIVIGSLTAGVAVGIDIIVDELMDWKFNTVGDTINPNSEDGTLAISLLYLMLFNVGMVAVATLLTCFSPVAAGSGIPEVKCYLNGVKIPGVTRLKTLVIKATGVLFSVSGGLFVGREGPMIHSGAVIAAGVPQFKLTYDLEKKLAPQASCEGYKYFRSDRQKRDFVSAGAAAGVAAAFGAPIGGVLFSLEEGASFWNQSLTWKSLLCAMTSTAVLNFFLSGYNYGNWSSFDNPGLLNFGNFQCPTGENCTLWSVPDLLIFAFIGIGGGLFGALFNELNYRLTRWRILNVIPKGRAVRVLEALLVASVTTTVTFTASMALGQCSTITNTTLTLENDDETIRQYFCAENQFNDMATLFFNGQEASIKALFHNPNDFALSTLVIFDLFFFSLACWTYGILVPSGLFVPCLLCGAAYGRIWGHVLEDMGYSTDLYAGSFALIGSAAFLGGVVRMTISLTVILIETTNEITYGMPIMVTLMAAKFVGDLFNIGLYDIHNEMKGIPFLEWDAPDGMDELVARDVMESRMMCVLPYTSTDYIIKLLKSCTHNAFPVVTPDEIITEKDAAELQLVSEDDGKNTLAASNIRFRHNSLVRAQKFDTSRRTQATTARSGTLSREEDINHIAGRYHEWERVCKRDARLRFHGLILRSQLVTLLKNDVTYEHHLTEEAQKKLNYWELIADYPRYAKLEDIDTQRLTGRKIKVIDYINNCPYVVSPKLPAPKVFNMFRTMGLRHLPVLNSVGQIVGIITRHDLTHEAMHEKVMEKASAAKNSSMTENTTQFL